MISLCPSCQQANLRHRGGFGAGCSGWLQAELGWRARSGLVVVVVVLVARAHPTSPATIASMMRSASAVMATKGFWACRAEAVHAPLPAGEREIARHLAEGATNQQIADCLVQSRRTIEEHVSNVLHKLGLRPVGHPSCLCVV